MLHGLLPVLVVVVIVGLIVIAAVRAVRRPPAGASREYPYEKEEALFTPAERSFLGVLERTINGRYRFMGKVRLADIVKVKSGVSKSTWQRAFNRVQSKHVDIVVCDPATLSVQFVIELDDATHNQPRRQRRDQLVDNVLHAAGVPIVHVTAKKGYSVQDIQDILSQVRIVART